MKAIRFLALYSSVLVLSVTGAVAREVTPGQVASAVGQLLQDGHYSGQKMEEGLSRRALRNYLESLDYDHLYFTQKDVDVLEALHGPALSSDVLSGNLDPVFRIFDLYKHRAEERIGKAREILKEDFDFQSGRSVEQSRAKSPWPADAAEADALWHDRLEGEMLDEKLSGHEKGARETVEKRCDEALRDAREQSRKETLAMFLSALAQSFDPHSDYLTKEDLEDLNSDMSLSMVGIGAVLSSEDGFTKIVDLLPGSPARSNGRIRLNDRIIGIAQGDGPFVDVNGMRLDRVLDMIRGKAGSTVRLKLMPEHVNDPSERRVVEIARREIKLKEDEAKAEVVERESGGGMERLGWLALPSVYGDEDPAVKRNKSVTRDARRLLTRLNQEKVAGLVLDLRGNGGGLLDEAVSLSGLFVGKGPVVQVKSGDGKMEVAEAHGAALFDGPMVVLTDRMTASAAEILASTMQDYGRAVIVGGERTFGKGTVQTVLNLSDFIRAKAKDKSQTGALQLTIAKYYRVAGGSPQLRGVAPDISLPTADDLPNSGEIAEKDPLPYDEIQPAVFQRDHEHSLFLSELRGRSAARVETSQEFGFVREDLARDRTRLSENRLSLNERTRRAEMASDKQRDAQRASERRAAGQASEKVCFITLETPRKHPERAEFVTENSLAPLNGEPARETDEPKAPTVDPAKDESLNILHDLIALSRAEKIARKK